MTLAAAAAAAAATRCRRLPSRLPLGHLRVLPTAVLSAPPLSVLSAPPRTAMQRAIDALMACASRKMKEDVRPEHFPATWRLRYVVPLLDEALGSSGCAAHMAVRRFSTEPEIPEPKLPLLTQIDFYHDEDIKHAGFHHPLKFLTKYPALHRPEENNPLIPASSKESCMLSDTGRILWQSAAELVYINKLRGYDIACALVEENLEVTAYGTFALKTPVSDRYNRSNAFKGYKALADLFRKLMAHAYGYDNLLLLTDDTKNWLQYLESNKDDRLLVYHATFLSPTGRVWLSLRVHSMIRNEVNIQGFRWCKNFMHGLLKSLPQVSNDVLENPLFAHLIQHGEKRKAQKTQTPRAGIPHGYLVVGLNRNGVLHRISKEDMEKLTEDRPVPRYCLWEMVQLLHHQMPMFLPRVQERMLDKQLWRYLDVGALWPRKEVYHLMMPGNTDFPTLHDTADWDPNNSMVFVARLDSGVTKEQLKQLFRPFGEIQSVWISKEKNCGLVTFLMGRSAWEAITKLDGTTVGSRMIRLSQAKRSLGKDLLSAGRYLQPSYDTYEWVQEMEKLKNPPTIQL